MMMIRHFACDCGLDWIGRDFGYFLVSSVYLFYSSGPFVLFSSVDVSVRACVGSDRCVLVFLYVG